MADSPANHVCPLYSHAYVMHIPWYPHLYKVSWNRGTPSSHPFINGIFHNKPSSELGVPPWLWKPPDPQWNPKVAKPWNWHQQISHLNAGRHAAAAGLRPDVNMDLKCQKWWSNTYMYSMYHMYNMYVCISIYYIVVPPKERDLIKLMYFSIFFYGCYERMWRFATQLVYLPNKSGRLPKNSQWTNDGLEPNKLW